MNDLPTFLKSYPGVKILDAILPDMNHLYRGKRLPLSDAAKALGGAMSLPGSIITVDQLGHSNDPGGLGISDGDPDLPLYDVADSLVLTPWASTQADAQVLLSFAKGTHSTGYDVDPRWFLIQAIKRLAEKGLKAVVAFELEFYLGNFDGRGFQIDQGLDSLGPDVYRMSLLDAYAPALRAMSEACQVQGIKSGAITKEYARGQFEINLAHQDDALKAADQCGLFRRLIKGCAKDHGLNASFMSKPFLDQSGSGMHVHVSLVDEAGNNVFDEAGKTCSPLLGQAIAGVLQTMPESMAAYAWTPNAYRRFLVNEFVPVNQSWGFENRAAAIRVPLSDGLNRRFEFRVSGAEANPHLVLACLLASIDYGLDQKLEAPDESKGNVGAVKSDTLSWNLSDALKAMDKAAILPDYFGDEAWRLLAEAKRLELNNYQNTITGHEYAWYLHSDP